MDFKTSFLMDDVSFRFLSEVSELKVYKNC
jgi:hypothetical protein